MGARVDLGRRGEEEAASLYRELGYEVVARNCRLPGGELDLVARRGRVIVFCEVKARSTDRFGLPSEAVNHRKQARIRRLAAEWLAGNRIRGHEIRFDVVSVLVDGPQVRVTHVPSAF